MSRDSSPERPSQERDEDLELEPFVVEDTPDDPIAQQPKWLYQTHPTSWYSKIYSKIQSDIHPNLLRLVRPRLTVRYILCSLFIFYALYCLVCDTPFLASKLPRYTGPYGVGAIDLEIPLPNGPQRVSDAVFKHSGDPAFDVESLLVTLYYPTDPGFHSPKVRYHWIPKPMSVTGDGFARLAYLDNFITRPLLTFALWGIASSITIPAEVDAPLLNASTPSGNGDESPKTFPVMVFSHGMASSRTDYTHFIGELAARGHVIAAIEHRDGSSPGSLIKLTGQDPGRRRLTFRASDLEGKVETPDFKIAQLAFRDAEILAAVNLLTSLNENSPVNNTRDPATTLSGWKGRLDLNLLTIGGHSYGATGALQALSTVASNAAAGLILDPGKSSGPLNPNATCPILVIHSNSWSKSHSIFYGRPHFDTVRDLVQKIPKPSWFLTSIGTSHPSVTDAPLLEPLILSWTTGADLDVKEALKEYVNVAYDFLSYVSKGTVEGLLGEKVTHEEYGKWVSDDRKKEFPKSLAKHWEVHVSPDLEAAKAQTKSEG